MSARGELLDRDVSATAVSVKEASPSDKGVAESSRRFWKWIAASLCLIAGVMCVFAVKLQSRDDRPVQSGELKPFDQPFIQTIVMFFGEGLCILVWLSDELFIKGKRKRAFGLFEFPTTEDLQKRLTPWWWWCLPSILDLTGTTISNVAFAITYGSTVQMLRNSLLVMTSITSLILVRRPLRVHEWLGVIFMTAGMVSAGIMSVINPDKHGIYEGHSWLGVVLTIGSTIFSAVQMTIEEFYFQKTYSPPMRAVGIEGLSGVVLSVAFIVVSHFAGFYNFAEGWYQMNHSSLLIGTNIWFLFSVLVFNGAGLMTTFLGSAVLRTVIDACRAPIVFLIELAGKLQAFTWGGLASLILSTLGFLTFSYIIPFVSKQRTPRAHTFCRKGVNCCCTIPLPPSDDELEEENL